MAVEEYKRLQELNIKNQTEAALHGFRVKHELLSRESQIQDYFNLKSESNYAKAVKINDKLKSSSQQTFTSETTIKSKRSSLGIAPWAKK